MECIKRSSFFEIRHPPSKEGAIPPNIRVGVDVPVTELVTEKYFFGGPFAD
jgi:hypothetical protein